MWRECPARLPREHLVPGGDRLAGRQREIDAVGVIERAPGRNPKHHADAVPVRRTPSNAAATEKTGWPERAPPYAVGSMWAARNASAIIGRFDQQRAERYASPLAPGGVVIVGPLLIGEAPAETALALRVRA